MNIIIPNLKVCKYLSAKVVTKTTAIKNKRGAYSSYIQVLLLNSEMAKQFSLPPAARDKYSAGEEVAR